MDAAVLFGAGNEDAHEDYFQFTTCAWHCGERLRAFGCRSAATVGLWL
jgi:hypothetical protein